MSIQDTQNIKRLMEKVESLTQTIADLADDIVVLRSDVAWLKSPTNPLAVEGQKQVVSGFDRTLTLEKRKA